MKDIEQKITAAQALLAQSVDPIAEATRSLYEAVNMLLFRVRDIDDNVKRMIYAMPISTETCCSESEEKPQKQNAEISQGGHGLPHGPIIIHVEEVPQYIRDAAMAVQMWMENNGHKKWKLFGIQSRED